MIDSHNTLKYIVLLLYNIFNVELKHFDYLFVEIFHS